MLNPYNNGTDCKGFPQNTLHLCAAIPSDTDIQYCTWKRSIGISKWRLSVINRQNCYILAWYLISLCCLANLYGHCQTRSWQDSTNIFGIRLLTSYHIKGQSLTVTVQTKQDPWRVYVWRAHLRRTEIKHTYSHSITTLSKYTYTQNILSVWQIDTTSPDKKGSLCDNEKEIEWHTYI